jgi:hypothetical protein
MSALQRDRVGGRAVLRRVRESACDARRFLSRTLTRTTARDRQPAPDALLPDVPGHLAEKILSGRAALEGERRQVTVLFGDIANFTAVSIGSAKPALAEREAAAGRRRACKRGDRQTEEEPGRQRTGRK